MTEKEYIKEQRLFNLHRFFAQERLLSFRENLNLWKSSEKKNLYISFF